MSAPDLLCPLLPQVAGGGRSSARETIGRVAAGAVAKKLLHQVRCGAVPQRGRTGWGNRAHGGQGEGCRDAHTQHAMLAQHLAAR